MHIPEDDIYLGRYVLERKIVSREALLECLFEVAHERRAGPQGFARPLGVVLTSRGHLNDEELNTILASCISPEGGARGVMDSSFGKLLVASGLISSEQVEQCVRIQKEARDLGKPAPRLGELIVRQGYATEPQVMRILAYQKKHLYVCAGCKVRVTSAAPPPGTKYRCKKCGGELAQLEGRVDAHTTTSIPMREATQGEDIQLEVDRAIAAYLKQKGEVRPDQIRDSHRMQMEFLRYGLIVPLLEIMRRTGAITVEQQKALGEVNFNRLVENPEWKKQTVPGYRILQRISAGVIASVYTAQPLFGGDRVSVKLLHPEVGKDPNVSARFEAEAALLKRFSCPNIVRGMESGSDRGNRYLVMEFVEGRTLGQAITEIGAFPLRNALATVRQVAEATRYLHDQGFAHQDIKPDNALVDGGGNVRLSDVSFAVPLGTGEEAAVRQSADMYALGILLYALLTGHEPFEGVSSEETVFDQMETGLPVPNLMVVSAPVAIIQLLKRIMHPDRASRFPNVGEIITAINSLLAQQT